LQKQFKFKEGIGLNLIGEAFNIFNETNIRGTSNNNYPGRSISIGPFQPDKTVNLHRLYRQTSTQQSQPQEGSSAPVVPGRFNSQHV
jgi:hypothetical protein